MAQPVPARAPERVENKNLRGFERLMPPSELKAACPATDEVQALVLDARAAIRALIRGDDARRLLVIVGPCSIHDPKAAYEYAERLSRLRIELASELLIVMRTYFEKPRTTVGWKGLLYDPGLDGTSDIERGILLARELLREIHRAGVPCAYEALDPITPQFVGDLLCWAAIGARTTESQTHREIASGLSMPVGFKNGTDGSLDTAVNALIAAGSPYVFLGIDGEGRTCKVQTNGNPDRHVILRGGRCPNYYREDVEGAARIVKRIDGSLRRPVMVDTSHGNSSKDHRRQGAVFHEVLRQFQAGQQALLGLLIESNLVEGRQDWRPGVPLVYGQSITDACIGWEETEELLREAASAVAQSRP